MQKIRLEIIVAVRYHPVCTHRMHRRIRRHGLNDRMANKLVCFLSLLFLLSSRVRRQDCKRVDVGVLLAQPLKERLDARSGCCLRPTVIMIGSQGHNNLIGDKWKLLHDILIEAKAADSLIEYLIIQRAGYNIDKGLTAAS